MRQKTLSPTDPPILLAGLIAARRAGDRLLARVFDRELRERGIDVTFRAPKGEQCEPGRSDAEK
jgi:hypothetical protein